METKIDKFGNVIIPIELREKLYLKPMEKIEIYAIDNEIRIRKSIPICIFCKCAVELVRYGNYEVCISCIDRLKNANVGDILYGVKS